MRKWRGVFFLLCLLLAGCGEEENGPGSSDGSVDRPDMDQVVNTHGKVENADRLDGFVSHVDQGEKDRVQVVSYTIEGDPIYHTLEFDGTAIQFTLDSSKDQYGSGTVSSMACGSISKKVTERTVDYVLGGCEQGKTFTVLTIEK